MRKDWNEYFFDLAHMAATRSTCPRLAVGAVIVKNNRVLSMGYNGVPSGVVHCTVCGCHPDPGCERTIHAEANALMMLGYSDLQGARMYVTDSPCKYCTKLIVASGIKSLYFDRLYRSTDFPLLVQAMISVIARSDLAPKLQDSLLPDHIDHEIDGSS